MDRLLGALHFSTLGVRTRNDDDGADRLNHRYTTFILLIFAIVVTTEHYVGQRINCWTPAHFTSQYIDYTNKICWVTNTYYIPLDVINIPENREHKKLINYYQWVPMILMIQAVFFYFPHFIWTSMNNHSGIDVPGMINAVAKLQTVTNEAEKRSLLAHTASQMQDSLYLVNGKHFKGLGIVRTGRMRNGYYLITLYLVVKLLYVVNAVGQLFLLNAFLRTDYHLYGLEVLVLLFTVDEWPMSDRFPSVTLCDFKVRQLANTHRHTVQCVLPINIFNEKIFIFMWFWIVLVAAISGFSFLCWLIRTVAFFNQQYIVNGYLSVALTEDSYKTEAKKETLKLFIRECLKQDGLLLLRLMELNSGSLPTAKLLAALFDCWKKSKNKEKITDIENAN